MTVLRTSALLRSRTPRMYSSLRSSRAAMVAALIIPRSAVLIHDQPDDHLIEIGPVVLRVAATTKLLAALSPKGQAGVVHKDDAELGKQIAPAGEQLLFHDVLAAA